MEGRSAAGQAAGYHFQVQRGLLSLIAGDDGTSVAIETLDDLVVEGDAGAVREFEQLKHSIRSGSLTERPVPRFVVFDQPSLPFFPQNVADRDAAMADVDWQAVRAMMRLADRVANSLRGSLQVIITDHATFTGEQWFDDALVEDWHTGIKLVPEDWPEN